MIIPVLNQPKGSGLRSVCFQSYGFIGFIEITTVNSCRISIPPGAFEGSVEKFNLEGLLERLRETAWNGNYTTTFTAHYKSRY